MDPRRRAQERPSGGGAGELVRWGVAASAGAVITAGLFITMVGLVDGQWILERLIRVFPLSEQPVHQDDLTALRPTRKPVWLSVEGTVGHMVGDRFVPLEDAEIVGTQSDGESRRIEVEAGGHFRFDATFPDPRSAASTTTQLVIRSPGCSERRVPVTRAWLRPRRIALDCG